MVFPPRSSPSLSTDSYISSSSSIAPQKRESTYVQPYNSDEGLDKCGTPHGSWSDFSALYSPRSDSSSTRDSLPLSDDWNGLVQPERSSSPDSPLDSINTTSYNGCPMPTHEKHEVLQNEQAMERAFDVSRYRNDLPLHLIDSKLLRTAHPQVEHPKELAHATRQHLSIAAEISASSSSLKRPLDHDHSPDSTWKRRRTAQTASQSRRQSITRQPPSMTSATLRRSRSLDSFLARHRQSGRFRGLAVLVAATRQAKPGFHVPPPVSDEKSARTRISRLRDREESHRQLDGLDVEVEERLEPVNGDDVEWGCIAVDLRREIMKWFYEVNAIPSRHSHRHARHESFANLFNHLHCSTETRYLAVSLFTRYFHQRGYAWAIKLGIIGGGHANFLSLENDDPGDDPSRMYADVMYERLVWDLALACLTIAVKVAQKEILRTLKYEIHDPTPQAFLSELPAAFPVLMEVLDDLNLDHPWRTVQQLAWNVVRQVTFGKPAIYSHHEPDYISFPISLITCLGIFCALMECLAEEYAKETTVPVVSAKPRRGGSRSTSKLRLSDREYVLYTRARAKKRAMVVINEMLAVMSYSKDEFDACRHWMSTVSPH
ncbi:hypothetical protein FRB97_003098 [Tulasnella sp. 331]|nr:hypothetical protein FRB97_003098 [Tulasnella sp. 331]